MLTRSGSDTPESLSVSHGSTLYNKWVWAKKRRTKIGP